MLFVLLVFLLSVDLLQDVNASTIGTQRRREIIFFIFIAFRSIIRVSDIGGMYALPISFDYITVFR